MSESREAGTASLDATRKELERLFFTHVIGLLVTLFGVIPGLLYLTGWLTRAVTLAAAVILFRLAPVNPRYKTAALCRCIAIVSGILTTLSGTLGASVLNLAAAICQTVACYQEYYAHGELIEKRDEKLARWWRALFIWSLVIEIFGGVLVVFAAVLGMMMDYASAAILTTVMIGGVVVGCGLQATYLVFLKKTRERLSRE